MPSFRITHESLLNVSTTISSSSSWLLPPALRPIQDPRLPTLCAGPTRRLRLPVPLLCLVLCGSSCGSGCGSGCGSPPLAEGAGKRTSH
eukprot:COSAG01_NODE_42623_length_438_cov_0.728614_1_plen_88_part_01